MAVRGDQSNRDDLDRAVEVLGGPPNVVIDDGSHVAGHASMTFRHLFPLMPAGAVYAIEDLHTSFWQDFGGGLPAPAESAVGLTQDLVVAVQVSDPTFQRRQTWGPAPDHWAKGVASQDVRPGLTLVLRA